MFARNFVILFRISRKKIFGRKYETFLSLVTSRLCLFIPESPTLQPPTGPVACARTSTSTDMPSSPITLALQQKNDRDETSNSSSDKSSIHDKRKMAKEDSELALPGSTFPSSSKIISSHMIRRPRSHSHASRQDRVHEHHQQRSRKIKTSSALQGSSLAAVAAISAYATLRGSIKLFHHARRGMLRQLLLDLCPVLSGHDYWLDFGSLLGLHRDNDLILHDNDIDLAILDPNWEELSQQLSKSLPQYTVKLEYPTDAEYNTVFLRVYCLLGFADIFGATEIDSDRILVDCGHGETTCIDKQIVVPTTSMIWKGIEIRVPRDLERALESRYGSTWKIPRYMDKGADTVEGNKTYARVFRALSKVGIRL